MTITREDRSLISSGRWRVLQLSILSHDKYRGRDTVYLDETTSFVVREAGRDETFPQVLIY